MGLEEVKNTQLYTQNRYAQQGNGQVQNNETVTVPIGQTKEKDAAETPIKGAELEHADEQGPKVYRDQAATIYNKDTKSNATSEAIHNYYEMKENGDLDQSFNVEKEAKKYVKNQQRKENFEGTVTYYDKAEYKEAEKARKAERQKLVEQYTNEGLSKKEAKKKADAQLVKNTYLRKSFLGIGGSARKFVNRNKDLFFDENNQFSNTKLKDFVLEKANIMNNEDGETTNYRYSLKERRDAAYHLNNPDGSDVKRRTTVHQQGSLAKKAGMSTEKNLTNLYRAGVIAATTAAGYGIGAAAGAISASATAEGTAIAEAAGNIATSTATASATAAISGKLIGTIAGAPLGLGLASLVKDKGEKIEHIKGFKQYNHKESREPDEPIKKLEPEKPQVPLEPLKEPQEKTEIIKEVEENKSNEPCLQNYVVGNNESIAKIAKRTGVPVKTILELNKSKLHKFYVNRNDCDNKKKQYGFRVGEQIELPCDANVGELKNSQTEKEKYRKAILKVIDQACPEKRPAFVYQKRK